MLSSIFENEDVVSLLSKVSSSPRYYDKKKKMKQAIKQSNIRQDTKTICRRMKRIEDEDIFE